MILYSVSHILFKGCVLVPPRCEWIPTCRRNGAAARHRWNPTRWAACSHWVWCNVRSLMQKSWHPGKWFTQHIGLRSLEEKYFSRVCIYICTWELWVREFIMKWGLNLFEVICWRVQGWGYRFQFQCFVAFIWVDALRGARQSDKSSWLLAGLDLDINLFLYCRQMCRGLLTAYLRLKNHQSWWALLLMKQTWHWS